VDNPFKSPAVISFCPGILGIERGLKRAEVHPRVMAYVEIEAYICANLVAGMEAGLLDPTPIWTDAKTFDARPFRGRIHGIIGGYPCPGESLAGLREGHLYKGFIWPYLRRATAATRPFFCFFENVDDHLTGTYPIIQRSLRNMGYRVEGGVYSAEEIGATHERQRLFILAIASRELQYWCGHEGSRRNEYSNSGQKLANSYSYGYGAGTGQIAGNGGKIESKAQREEWNDLLRQWMRDVIRDSGQELAYSNSSGQQEQRNDGKSIKTEDHRAGNSGTTLWPAGQGIYQYDWEAPRTIEPGLGCTIDGYNFREDLLRALGNSVVEQTAELAFIDLLKKHLKNV
jgi:DNA (cytosine-5)-methyltransferase 1